jgi:hypothetical protein
MKRNIKNIIKGVCGVSVIASLLFASPVFSADKNLLYPSSSVTGGGNALSVTDVLSAGTNTTHTQVVDLGGIEDLYIFFHCPVNGVVIGTATFGLEESFDNVTWGSVTASEMTRATNTLLTSSTLAATTGSQTSFLFSGDYRGTHTSSFVGSLGTSTSLTTQFYHVKPYGAYLRTQCALTSPGTDTVQYKIIMRKSASAVNKF